MPRPTKHKHLNKARYQGTSTASNTTSETANIVEISEPPTDINAISKSDNVIDVAELSESNVLSESTNTIDVPESNIDISRNTIRLERKRAQLIDQIKLLPDDEVEAACHLFETMRYSSGNRKIIIFFTVHYKQS